ncbi:MAG: amidohydrolase family protein [Pseudoalteromonas tunicata]|nr:amidohydrolase family protein [Pseudoalteromonas tunicata]AXT30409.1 amidohydrolase [Pseudoalteromonas tunicata]MDP4982265.1 amidohydrolase family protein [Pseudoalteromonas tunicata]MDP5211994.1 amidohydrolase family protein [Pseudoalteromonas tunicata]
MMKVFKKSMLAAALLTGFSAYAAPIAITNATVYTANEQGILKNATVVMDEGKIIAINPESHNATQVIDANGRILSPGIISTMNQLGLVEVGAVAASRDAGDKKADITFDASLAYNPRSSLIAYARKGGITRDLVIPTGGEDIFAGLGFVVDLSGEFDSVLTKEAAVVVSLGERSSGSRAYSLQTLIDTLDGQVKKLAKAEKASKKTKKDDKADKEDKEPSKSEKLLTAVLKGEKPLVVYVSRAADMLELIKVKQQFNVNMVFVGAHDATLIKQQLVDAKVPVVLSVVANLPGSFDSLHSSLTTAGELEKAGAKVLLTIGGDASHNMYQLRYDTGIAVANGMSAQGALKAITANVAEVFGINAGEVAVGKAADLVLWSADPFELSSKVDQMWIGGKEYTTESRQDKLAERYIKQSAMPRAYTK